MASASLDLAAMWKGSLAYRSPQTARVFDTPDAQKRHQPRNCWTGEYSFGK
ncbi:MAG TPA: hypothetical protein VF930_11850 [Stellaceae bacterium]